jgi:hypothetical protein
VRELQEIAELTGSGIDVVVHDTIDIATQSRSSAETAAHLNQHLSLDALAERFEMLYREDGHEYLWRAFVEVRKGGDSVVQVIEDESAWRSAVSVGRPSGIGTSGQ